VTGEPSGLLVEGEELEWVLVGDDSVYFVGRRISHWAEKSLTTKK